MCTVSKMGTTHSVSEMGAARSDATPAAPRIPFGQTDLQVSRLCQGTAFRHLPRADGPESLAVLHHCLDQGVNFFDSAQAYGWGGAEEVLGKAVAGRRDEVVLCTKVPASLAPPDDDEPGKRVHYTRAHLTDRLEESLRRLRTDYVDLYLLHHRDEGTPPEEIAAVMQDLVQSGKTRYWGVSNHSAAEVEAFLSLAPIAGVEDYYNIAGSHYDEEGRARVAVYEEEMIPLLKRENLGCMAFSPMDTGLLAPEKPDDPALAELAAAIDRVAADLESSRASVCVAWVLHQGLTCVLAGSESAEHVDMNLAGTRLQLPAGALATLDQARQTYRLSQQEPSA
jgi:aryl-alcohol dehydrogenase-like predicted oxidoreductase